MAVVQLQAGRQKRVQAGHPWVYRTEVAEIHTGVQPGQVVDVVDHRGHFLGRGYINPRSQILVRILTRQQEDINAAFWRRRLEEAIAYRRRVVGEAEAYRLAFAEADLLPGLIVDRFGEILVLQALTLGIALWQDTLVELLVDLLQPAGIYERNDVPVRELEGLAQQKGYLYGSFDTRVRIKENGALLEVDLAEGQKTGHFLDQRENRAVLGPYTPGARVLDCFCHNGGFALQAALGGAREVIGVDSSTAALAQARRNAELNSVQEVCRFQEANVFDELRRLEQAGERFDAVVLDPPAFVKSKHALEGALRGYKEINLRAMKLLLPGGFLFTASCSYHMPEEMFWQVIAEAAADVHRQVRIIERRHQAKDHPSLLANPESSYLKFFVLQVL